MISCSPEHQKGAIYQTDSFTIFPDRVVQGEHVAQVISPQHVKSNYKSPASDTYSRLIKFKFSINEKDNELPAGIDHWVFIGEEHSSAIVTFGEAPAPLPDMPEQFLPTNYAYTFQVDMSPVLTQFEETGYYEAFDGTRVAKDDFKGFYIAGGSEPLTWDFVNLHSQGLQLKSTSEAHLFEITLTLNPFNEKENTDKEWKLSTDISSKPSYTSDQPLVDALFNMSLEEAIMNIEPDSTLRSGAKWGGVWTRDISYSIFLAFAYHEPEIAKISLMKKVKRNRIIQDTGSGGAWPVSSDRTTWALAAWEIYKVTGEMDWLEQAFTIIKNSVEDDARVIKSQKTGMHSGESSFLDWREQTYPKWMSNMDIYVSENLGTNVVHYQAHQILAQMAQILGEDDQVFLDRAGSIKNGVNEHLWMKDKGYYAQYLYGRSFLNVSPRFEALGEALSIIFDVADKEKTKSIVSKSPVIEFGTTCIYPQIPNIPPYHNNGIWPFVQSYWNLAAAKAGNEKALNHGLASIYRAGGLFLTNYENFVAESGDFLGTEINSHRMLWSMAGNLAMVHRVFIGMSFETDGIQFNPVIPKSYGGNRNLTNFKYRNAILDINVEGFGNTIKSITLDGEPLDNAFLPASIEGAHKVYIVMDSQSFDQEEINLVNNRFSVADPRVEMKDNQLSWPVVTGAIAYHVYKNGIPIARITDTTYTIEDKEWAEYKVTAEDEYGVESFTSEPLLFVDPANIQRYEMEQYAEKSALSQSNHSGEGFVEISNAQNRSISFNINVNEPGEYLLDFRYSNGSGPWNTDNKCAIRSLYANEEYIGALVFPQRGKDEWSDWGFSNAYPIAMKPGVNQLRLSFEESNINMNVDVNKAMLDFVRIIKK